MSRSRKKISVTKDSRKGMKACANRKMRRQSICIANGNDYRKLTSSYDISDWRFRCTYAQYAAGKESCRKDYESGLYSQRLPRPPEDWSTRMSYWAWYKTYKRK